MTEWLRHSTIKLWILETLDIQLFVLFPYSLLMQWYLWWCGFCTSVKKNRAVWFYAALLGLDILSHADLPSLVSSPLLCTFFLKIGWNMTELFCLHWKHTKIAKKEFWNFYENRMKNNSYFVYKRNIRKYPKVRCLDHLKPPKSPKRDEIKRATSNTT